MGNPAKAAGTRPSDRRSQDVVEIRDPLQRHFVALVEEGRLLTERVSKATEVAERIARLEQELAEAKKELGELVQPAVTPAKISSALADACQGKTGPQPGNLRWAILRELRERGPLTSRQVFHNLRREFKAKLRGEKPQQRIYSELYQLKNVGQIVREDDGSYALVE
jgi:hypothetical protein